MELWLDTADITAIKQANELGLIHGVTTNPSIFARAGQDAQELIQSLLQCQSGLLALQVTRTQHVNEMVQQALAMSKLSPRIVIKIPATMIGFSAMGILKKHQVPVLATAISSISQFTFASLAGADYAALYLSHMEKSGKEILAEIDEMLLLADTHQWSTKLMGAAFADANTAQSVIASCVPTVTLPPEILTELFAIDPLVAKQLQQFDKDWQAYQEKHVPGLLADKELVAS